MLETAVTHWFGDELKKLHPLLQQLHQQGGKLKGTVNIQFGKGIAGWLGKRIAHKMGIPTDRDTSAFQVDISHQDNKLYWSRTFYIDSKNNIKRMQSIFEPIGHWPDGYWIEQTGKLKLYLTVDVKNQGWYWRSLKTKLGWIRIPQWLMPGSNAWKRITNNRYEFNVEFRMPLLGMLLRYNGTLDALIDLEGGGSTKEF